MDLTPFSLVGTAVFAASGALVADRERFDIVGALFLSAAAGLGGGTVVDLLVGQGPVRWVADPTPLWVALAAGALVFVAVRFVRPPLKALDWADAAGLAVFVAAGMERLSSSFDLAPGMVVTLAAVGACGGGLVRDVIANRAPMIFAGELYVTAALLGGAAYLAAARFIPFPDAALWAALAVTALVRGAGLVFGLRLIHGRGK